MDKENKKAKKKYKKPELKKEPLVIFGAICNGTTVGQRKSVTTPPANCNAGRLIS